MANVRVSRSRTVAFKVLGEVRRRDAHAREVLRSSKELAALDGRDKALATRLVLGVQASIGMLDACVNAHLRKGRLEPRVRDALRLGAYELMFLDTPQSAAVSQAVELVRLAAPRAAGLANAVLRKVAQQDVPLRNESLARVRKGNAGTGDMALASGYPEWLLERLAQDRGIAEVREIALSALEPAPIYVAPNEARNTAEDVFRMLEEAGLHPRNEECGAIRLDAPSGLAATGMVEDATVVVSDLSAQRISSMVAPQKSASMLEVGQGRGTKSILVQNAALRAGASVRITGVDIEGFKVRVAQRRMERAGLGESVRCCAFDALDLDKDDVPKQLSGPFDVVFVDAPCSGTGTMRRHPEIPWKLDSKGIHDLSLLQLGMLKAASTRVAPSGTLCYATCSVLSQEDKQVVEAFLQSDEGAVFELVGEPFITIPTVNGPDGHFCATLRNKTLVHK